MVLLSSSQNCISKECSSNFSRTHRTQQFNVGKSPLQYGNIVFRSVEPVGEKGMF